MKHTELRIGNILTGGIVASTYTTGFSVFDGTSEFDSSYQIKEWNEEQPIPLTEEWLLKLGFSKEEYQDGYIGIDVRNTSFVLAYPKTRIAHSEYFCWCYKQDRWPLYNEVKYVHQLQNLFYAIAEEELTIKPLPTQKNAQEI